MSNWLMIRGFWDKNNQRSLKEDSDMWVQLFSELVPKEDNGVVWYVGGHVNHPAYTKYDYIFARGGHLEYEPILRKNKGAFVCYYGAGARIIPEKDLGYSLILCDTEEQVRKCKKKYPHIRAELWIKPAAKHFKPVECKKEYDVCYVADCHSKFQKKIKNLKWVYKTAPKDLKILHLGKSFGTKPPSNITVKKVSRLEMPKWYSKARVLACPYRSYDSTPRVIPEALACGLPIIALDSVNFWCDKYPSIVTRKEYFWEDIKTCIKNDLRLSTYFTEDVNGKNEYYKNNLSIEKSAKLLRSLIVK